MKKSLLQYVVNIGLTGASILVIFGLTETTLHFTSYRNLLPKTHLDSMRRYLKADPVRGYDILEDAPPTAASVDTLPYTIWSNELGCFDIPYRGENNPLLLVGDSFTFAFAPFQDKWGTKIEKLLELRVLKCGVGGYGTKQELRKAEEIVSRVKHRPGLIIVGYFINDLEDDYLFPNSTIVDGYPIRTQQIQDMDTGAIVRLNTAAIEAQKKYGVKEYPGNFVLRKVKRLVEEQSIIYFLAKNYLRPMILSTPVIKDLATKARVVIPLSIAFSDKPWVQKAWPAHLENLKAFQALAERHGSRLLVVVIPSKEQVYPALSNWQGIDRERPQKILSAFFERERIAYIDALPLFAEYAGSRERMPAADSSLYWRSDPHLNRKGNELLALAVSRYILDHNLVPVRDRKTRLATVMEGFARLRTTAVRP